MDSHNDNRPTGGDPSPVGDEDSGRFLERLLDRDEAAGDGVAHALPRLRTALMHCTELHAMRRRKGTDGPVGHRVVKHVFLLADGTGEVLWEVEHNTHPDGRTRHRLLPDRGSAEAYARERFGEPPLLDLWPRLAAEDGLPVDPVPGHGLAGPALDGVFGFTAGSGPRPDPDFVAGTAGALDPPADPASELGRMIAEIFFTARRAEHRTRRSRADRTTERGQSADHAWRVLRRAENADRPGEAVRRRLRAAVGHETVLITRRHDATPGHVLEWALYQHAFLLADGAEISLWELEHTRSPGALAPVCEVYLDESTARDRADHYRAGE
ncbi:DUF6227 family protein [Streptomyces sp. SL13]|jgi:hypothetical protein|uniref:DUF6227 family protein n=1 Tax=Streptantibioticus silvisoli TaxID=2705255 RepID=A0AA90H0Z7_9ACTN|nr:DUF6227 family protein [Streptantibioticus silvisoli]MDI5961551.1 DUF6227 family protein [Streptantibioticus silvisoli]MDI5968132.1 DUF6227 family protein [Streptantibioticus silvisoli]